MKIRFFPFIIFTMFLISDSCIKESDNACGVKHPVENLRWLKDLLQHRLCTEIYLLTFEGMEYIIVSDCPGPDAMAVFYDCQGNKTCEYGGANPGGGMCIMPITFTFEFYLHNKKLIYKQA
jgi:hypothetical protein